MIRRDDMMNITPMVMIHNRVYVQAVPSKRRRTRSRDVTATVRNNEVQVVTGTSCVQDMPATRSRHRRDIRNDAKAKVTLKHKFDKHNELCGSRIHNLVCVCRL